MYCGGCGQALVAGQGFCPRCGRASTLGTRSAPPSAAYGSSANRWAYAWAGLARRIDQIAIGWYVYAGLVLLFGTFGLSIAHAAISSNLGPEMDGSWRHGHHHLLRFFNGPELPLFFVKLGWLFVALRAGFAALAGYGLSRRASWSRGVAIFNSILALFHFPFGTALGVWTLVVLSPAPNAAVYETMVRE